MLEDFGRKKHSHLYYIMLAVFVVAVFVLQSSTGLVPKVMGVSPAPLLALTITIGFFNNEIAGFMIGLMSGTLVDFISDKFNGFNTLIYIAVGLGAALLAEYFVNRRFFPCLVTSIVMCLGYYFIYWLCFELSEGVYYLVRIALVQALYTWLFIIPFYYFLKYFSKKFIK